MKTISNKGAKPSERKTNENNLPHIREVKNLKELNELGCHYINTANQANYTRMITRTMRWLTVRAGNDYMSSEQEKACKRIEDLINTNENNIDRQLNLYVLLERDPRNHSKSKEYAYIKNLILLGADVRFIERESKMKLVLQDNELYLSFSNDVFRMVSVGYHYVGKNKADGLCRYFANEFDKQFEQAHRLTVKEDKIVVDNAYIGEQVKQAFHLTAREWAIYVLTLVTSFILGIILQNCL